MNIDTIQVALVTRTQRTLRVHISIDPNTKRLGRIKVEDIHDPATSHDLPERKFFSDFILIRHFQSNYDLYSKSVSYNLQVLVIFMQIYLHSLTSGVICLVISPNVPVYTICLITQLNLVLLQTCFIGGCITPFLMFCRRPILNKGRSCFENV